MKKFLDNYRYLNLLLLSIGIGIYFFADWYWGNICAVSICDVYFIDAYLAPLREGGLVIAVLALPFFFLPTHYFRSWAIWLFTPLLLWSVYRLSLIDPNSSNMFAQTREEIASGMLAPWLIFTLVFIIVHWYRSRRMKG